MSSSSLKKLPIFDSAFESWFIRTKWWHLSRRFTSFTCPFALRSQLNSWKFLENYSRQQWWPQQMWKWRKYYLTNFPTKSTLFLIIVYWSIKRQKLHKGVKISISLWFGYNERFLCLLFDFRRKNANNRKVVWVLLVYDYFLPSENTLRCQ